MQNEVITSILESLFLITIPNEELDEGDTIEDSSIFKLVRKLIPLPKIRQSEIESYCLNFAIRAIAIEFWQRGNHGFYVSESYLHLFEAELDTMSLEELVHFCSYYRLLDDFESENLTFNYGNSLVANDKTKEVLSEKNIKNLIITLINYELAKQIIYVKLTLIKCDEREVIISLIAEGDQEENIEEATNWFNDLMKV